MSERFHELDPDGDVFLVLHDPQEGFALWDDSQEHLPPVPPSPVLEHRVSQPESVRLDSPDYRDQPISAEESNAREQTITLPRDESPSFAEEVLMPLAEKGEIQIRVSSNHLALASTYFERMLRGNWKEGHALRSDGHVGLDVGEWDHEAFLILMNVIHGRTRAVPQSISLELLAKIAVLVDYYKCEEVIRVFLEMWISQLKENLPETYSRDLILWICISWVFRLSKQFTIATNIALQQSRGPIQTLGLPIPARVAEIIDQQRQESIDRIVEALHNLFIYFSHQNMCSPECSSMLLGAFTKEMDSRSLSSPRPKKPFLGISFAETARSIRDMQLPVWCYHRPQRYSCSFDPRIFPIVGSRSMKGPKGLTLDLSLVED
ncbi:hypothetical protein GP486_007519 [Trichoglossum hirsutum]|uniref:BTB domain-containing protein n=1 Tax=Trichoglossum hirsutum TaxID=265104 RepID=A0A9P8ICL3_9PEZI|nr:hypothetical protein GP486_007519 [Trichoglossum hirsutum]